MEHTAKWIAIVVSIVLICTIALVLYTQQQEAAAREEYRAQLVQQARPYREELERLTEELKTVQSAYTYQSAEAELMLGFFVTELDHIPYIQGLAEDHDISPVLIVKCTEELDSVLEIIDAADEDWEIMLYSREYAKENRAEIRENIQAVREHLQEQQRKDTGILILDYKPADMSMAEAVLECDMQGYITYHSSPSSGQDDNGAVYFDYSSFSARHFTADALTSLNERMELWATNRASMLCIFNAAVISSSDVDPAQLDAVLQTLDRFAGLPNCGYSSVEDVVDELSQINELEADHAEELDRRAAALQKRIDELTTMIDALYRS